MSEMLIEHPITVIESLLKLKIGDEGRLKYLKNTIKNGDKVYDSDKEFLRKMEYELNKTNSVESDLVHDKQDAMKSGASNYNEENPKCDSELPLIQNLIDDLKKNNSRLVTNLELLRNNDLGLMAKLELLRINHKIATQSKTKESYDKFEHVRKNNTVNLINNIKKNPIATKSYFSKLNKHDLMMYASIGAFTLWFASYRNIIDLGSLQNIFLGLSAGFVVGAGYLYKKKKQLEK